MALIGFAHWGIWAALSESLESNRIEKIQRNLLSLTILQANAPAEKTTPGIDQGDAKATASQASKSQSAKKLAKTPASTRTDTTASPLDSTSLQTDAAQLNTDGRESQAAAPGADAPSSVAVDQVPMVPRVDSPIDRSPAGPTITVNNQQTSSAPASSTDEKSSQQRPDAVAFGSAWVSIKVPPPESKKLVFTVLQGDSGEGSALGVVTLDFSNQQGSYTSRFEIRFNWATRLLADDRQWLSTGKITETGLQPLRFTEKRGKRPERTVELDPSTQVIKFGDTPAAFALGLQDRISVMWQLGSLARVFANEPSKFIGRDIDLPLIVSSKIVQSRWRAEVEMLPINATVHETIHFVRTDARDDDLRFEFWLAVKEQMSPIKIQLSDGKGRKFELLPQR